MPYRYNNNETQINIIKVSTNLVTVHAWDLFRLGMRHVLIDCVGCLSRSLHRHGMNNINLYKITFARIFYIKAKHSHP